MRKLAFYLIVILISCEEVVEIDAPAEEPRLIIDALIRVDESLPVVNVDVKVSLSSSFFESTPVTDLNQITITNFDKPSGIGAENVLFLIESEPGSGIYQSAAAPDFFTEGLLVLQMNHQGELYISQTNYVPVVPIDTLGQGSGILTDEDDTEIVVTFTDDGEREDFYLFDFGDGEFFGTRDTFYQGQEFTFSYFSGQKPLPGEEITVSILGADETFYNYMQLLVDLASDDLGLFDTPVATPRGNIFNVTELDNRDVFDNVDLPDNFPLGFFAVVQTHSRELVIE